MQAVDRLILRRLQSDVVLINQVGHYIVNSGGKRLRPLAVLLSARACGYQGDRHIDLAAVVEFIHTATLLHDDVVDGSELRRSRETANARMGKRGERPGGGFPLLPRLRDDGGREPDAGDGHPLTRHQPHRRGRGSPATELQ